MIVDLDEESLGEIGQWPWPRDLVADLVSRMFESGAVAVGFDVVFAEPDRMSPGHLADSLSEISEELREELRRLPSNDQKLAAVFRSNRVVLGQSGYQRRVDESSRPLPKVPLATIGGDPRPFLVEFPGVVRNVAELEAAAPGHGMFSLLPDRDGIVRRVPALMTVDGVVVPTLALEMLRLAAGGPAYVVDTDQAGVSRIVLAGVEIPTDRNGRLWVHYSRREASRYISAKDLLADRVAKERLAGKLVLVGTSAAGLFDLKATPVDRAMPGVEVQAQILETVLIGSALRRPHYALGAEFLMTAAAGLLMIALVPFSGALFALLSGTLLAVTLASGSWLLFAKERILVDVAFALTASFAIYVLLVFFNYFREEAQKREVRTLFAQFMSPQLLEQLVGHSERLALGGETKDMSLLFCDIRDFTTITERFKADPQFLTALMNRFLTEMTSAILKDSGTIDKYMGDAILAFWNAPLDDPLHARHACDAALDMLRNLERLNGEPRQQAGSDEQRSLQLRMGIGINSGSCVVGNIGSAQHFDYSVLGDSVNLASRLEGQSKVYGVGVVVGWDTVRQVMDEFAFLELDLIRVKGRMEPARIYALLGDAALASDPTFQNFVHMNGRMLAAYRDQEWEIARQALSNCRALAQDLDLDQLFEMWEDRILDYKANPKPEDWDGVFEPQTK